MRGGGRRREVAVVGDGGSSSWVRITRKASQQQPASRAEDLQLQSHVGKSFPIKPKLKPKARTLSQTPESKYWTSFKPHQIPNLVSSIQSLDFSPNPPHLFAAAHSASLTLPKPSLSTSSSTPSRTSSPAPPSAPTAPSSPHPTFPGSFKSRRQNADPTSSFEVSRSSVKYWDVAGESVLSNLLGHKDYVRCGDCSPVNAEMFVTGSYDHTVKLWDVRVENSRSVMEANHGKPIEDVMFLPSGGLLAIMEK
ncbi:hypothetical protein Q3G72_021213 [Acer saccharum]|nr:hypothetical protein Q3G72_021213 [Acer saccharum]